MISLLEIANSIDEAEMKLKPKGGGKVVVFKNKDNYEKALKSGDYEEPEGSKKVKSKGSDIDFDRAADDEADDMDRDARFAADAEDEPKGKLPPKMQNAVDELEDLQDPDEVEGWLEDHQRKLMGGKIGRGGQIELDKFVKAFRDMEDSYDDAEEYDEKLQDFKDMVDKAMDRYRKKSESITINGKQYRPIKESKKNPQLFKEIYERTFRSLK